MVSVFMDHGYVMDMQTVQMVEMKPTVLLPLARIKDYGIVVMANVLIQVMFVMAQVNFVTLDGALTVPMAQMKA